MFRFFIAVAVIGVLSFLPGFAQTADQQASQPTTGVPAPAGTDEAGRPVQPVGTEAPLQVPETSPDQKQAFSANVKDIYFDFDKAEIRPDDREVLQGNADWLKAHPNVAFTIEGDADERGDIVYNVFLSDMRALETRDALLKLGVPEKQILYATGWGKLYPVCTDSNETCWSRNRRSHFAAWAPEDLSQRARALNSAMSNVAELK